MNQCLRVCVFGVVSLFNAWLTGSNAGAVPLPLDPVQLRNTYYYVVLEREYEAEPIDARILSMSGEVLAQVSGKFKRAVDIEGTGRLRDGRVINYAGRKEDGVRYLIARAHWGYGVGSCELRPFKTVAVDPSVVPLGSTVYIAETDGMTLPDGKKHDGIWRAEDVGGAIKKDRVDLFVGDGDQGAILEAAGITNLRPLSVKMLDGPKPGACVFDGHP